MDSNKNINLNISKNNIILNNYNNYNKYIINYIIKIVISLFILFIFYIIAYISKKKIMNYVNNIKNKNKINYELLYKLLSNIFYYLFLFIGLILALSNLDIDISSLLIIFSGIALAIAISIKITFTQIISGFIIIFFNYFNIGDLVEINNKKGYIKNFNFINTTITLNNIDIVIPNNIVTDKKFINYYINKTLYFNFKVKISNNNQINYDILLNNIKNALIQECKYIIDKNKVYIYINDMSSYGTELFVLLYINSEDYFNVRYLSKLIVRNTLENNNILLLDNFYL